MTGEGPDDRHDGCKRKTVNGVNQPIKLTGNTSNDEGKTSDDENDNENENENESPYETFEDGFDATSMFENMIKYCPGVYNFDKEICCLLKMYDMCGKSFRLNDVIEVVGIYTDDSRYNGSKSKSKNKSRLISSQELGPEDSDDLSGEDVDVEGVYGDEDINIFMDLPTNRYCDRC